jgi:hypothetical protein
MAVRIRTAEAFESNPNSDPLLISNEKERKNSKRRATLVHQNGMFFDDGLIVRRTLKTVRRLHKQGKISLSIKRKLLYSIMEATANDNVAQVVSAYEMLIEEDENLAKKAGEKEKGDKGKNDICYEEFIDQCHIICENIPLETKEEDGKKTDYKETQSVKKANELRAADQDSKEQRKRRE